MGAQGIAFAVASNTANFVVSEILGFGQVRRAFIGVAGDTVTLPRRVALQAGSAQTTAVRVRRVEPGSPAANGGLHEGVYIIAVDTLPVAGVDDLIRHLDGTRIGRMVALTVYDVEGNLLTRYIEPAARSA